MTESADLRKELTELKREFKGIASAELTLSVNPDDPKANLVVGRFYCLVKKDWTAGLACLLKGSDKTLKELAAAETAGPRNVAKQVELSDRWWSIARKERGTVSKREFTERARLWLQHAFANSQGIERLRIEKKLEALPAPPLAKGVDRGSNPAT